MTTYLTTGQVIGIHDLESGMPVRDETVLDATVNAPRATWAGDPLRPGLLQQAAALLIGISQAQAFVDGNKRTAWIALDVFLRLNGTRLTDISPAEVLALMDDISTDTIDETGVADWLGRRSTASTTVLRPAPLAGRSSPEESSPEEKERPMTALTVTIEIPKGTRNKYEVDHDTGRIHLDRVLFTSMAYPADYGYIDDTSARTATRSTRSCYCPPRSIPASPSGSGRSRCS